MTESFAPSLRESESVSHALTGVEGHGPVAAAPHDSYSWSAWSNIGVEFRYISLESLGFGIWVHGFGFRV